MNANWLCLFFALGLMHQHIAAQTKVASNEPLAFVGDQPITIADVDLQLGRTSTDDTPSTELNPSLQATTVHLIALQRQSLHTLRGMKRSVADDELTKWFDAHPLTEAQRRIPGEDSMRELVEFRLAWQPYLAQHATEKNLQRHFENQRRRFDGTIFSLEMVSLSVPPGQSEARQAAADELNDLVKRALSNGDDLSAMAEDNASIEWFKSSKIRGSGALHPALIDAILKLEKGKVSEPVHSPLGVHVIHLIDVIPGAGELPEAKGEVRAHMLYYLLEHLAAKSAQKHPFRAAESSSAAE